MKLDAAAIASATGGRMAQGGAAGPIQTDTRSLERGSWFLALVGPRFDGHTFLEAAAKAGAAGCVVNHVPADWPGGVVVVEDTTRALQDLGRYARSRFTQPVVGITGSSGKTTTRALVALALSPMGPIHQTTGNLNNHLGVPLTLLATPEEASAMVVEMGTSGPGEIEFLARLGEPDVRLIVNVGPAHLEELGGLDGVQAEKGALFRTARPGDTCCVNVEDERVMAMPLPAGVRRIGYGAGGDIALAGVDIEPSSLLTVATFDTPQGRIQARIPAPGRHVALNAAGALAVAAALGVDLAAAAAALSNYAPGGDENASSRTAQRGSGTQRRLQRQPTIHEGLARSVGQHARLPHCGVGRHAGAWPGRGRVAPRRPQPRGQPRYRPSRVGGGTDGGGGTPRSARRHVVCGPGGGGEGAQRRARLRQRGSPQGQSGVPIGADLAGPTRKCVHRSELMLYWLFVEPGPLADALPGTNVFRYISFRTAWGMITALMVSYLVFPAFIRWMKQRKVDQIIRSDGPESHLLNKVGTPTMGGVPMLAGVALATVLWSRIDQPAIWMVLIVMLGYGAIGFVDDWKKVMQRSTAGLAGRMKLLFQILIGGGVLAWGYVAGVYPVDLSFPFFADASINFAELWPGAPDALGWLYVALALFIVVGSSNAVNLTDGLDGLAIGPVMTSSATYGLIAYLTGHVAFSAYLDIPYVAGTGELTVIAFALVGAGLGFLWYNAYPASIFMGDVGSLALGGTLAMLAVLSKHEVLLAIVGGIFVLETLSVIIQVTSFKLTGKRVFAMAPIHHHYEKLGWSEPKIIVRFWIISVVLALVALSTLKLR